MGKQLLINIQVNWHQSW